MDVKELYQYITKHMSAEQALLNLLEGHVLTYEKLKFSEGEEIHPVMLITMAAMELNWEIVISDKTEEIQGLIVGSKEYLDEILEKSDDKNKGIC
jgi:hypothetical protein